MSISNYPHRTQGFDYDCGATAVLTVLHYYGYTINEQGVFDLIGTDKDGTSNDGIEIGLKKLGVNYHNVLTLNDIDVSVDKGYPVVICWATYPLDWHYSVIIRKEGRDYIVSDPWVVSLARVPIDVFDKIWHEPDGTRWGVAVTGEPKYTGEIMPDDIRLAAIREYRNAARVAAIADRITARETVWFPAQGVRHELEMMVRRVEKWLQAEKEAIEGGWATEGHVEEFSQLEEVMLNTIKAL